jgi:hypothetical protein
MVKTPFNIKEPEQLRPAIIRGKGTTDSERYLASVADRSFLNLWSYPSPYRNQGIEGEGDGKEVCDLLVICGQHIIIFSEKTVSWPSGSSEIAWRRWSKNAIRDALKQIKGAERWISEHPDRIFLDRRCKVPFPIDIPPPERRKIHRIVVANGAVGACRDSLKSTFGSLIIDPSILGDAHWPDDDAQIKPFKVGDIDPDGPLVHVFNEAAFDIVMSELDTITDLADYLTAKERFIRSGKLIKAAGEENLVAYYSIRVNSDGFHDFVLDNADKAVTLDAPHFAKFSSNPRYIAKKQADRISYFWDGMIEVFTKPMLDGTSLVPEGFEYDLRRFEIGIRHMALEGRFVRRSLGEAFSGALLKGKDHDSFMRFVMPSHNASTSGTAYFIRTIKYLAFMDKKGGYDGYRKVRSNHAQILAEGILEKHPDLKRVIGMTMEPQGQNRGGSEDMIYMEQVDWTDEQRRKIRGDCRKLNMLQNLNQRPWTGQEFPEVEAPMIWRAPSSFLDFQNPPMNREQRRALKARMSKARR